MDWENNELNPVTIVRQATNEALELKPHFHNSYEIIYILEGKIEIKINQKVYTAGSNDIIFISNLESHQLKVLEYPYIRYFILIKPAYFQSIIHEPILLSIFKHRPQHFHHIISLDPTQALQISTLVKDSYEEFTEKKDFWQTVLNSYLSKLFVRLYRNYKQAFPVHSVNSSMKTVMEIQKYVEEHFMNELSLKEIARLFYTDMYYLSHLFKKVTGFTFKEYLILQRISKAKELLFHTMEDITWVSANSGFNNVNHFIRIFKKFEGITPYQYRKNLRSLQI